MSKSRSKTRAISRSTPKLTAPPTKSEIDVQSVQRNLLALISHELRTPLAGVIQALELAEGSPEFFAVAKRQARRLEFALAHLLDISAFDSNHFRLRLKEIELSRIVRRAQEDARRLWPDFKVEIDCRASVGGRYLGDAQRLERATLLFLDAAHRGGAKSVSLRCNGKKAEVLFSLPKGEIESWDEQVLAAKAGLEAGFGAKELSFPDAALSEAEFLARSKEGLGGGLSLAAFIVKAHGGNLHMARDGVDVHLTAEIGALTPQEQLRAVLESRAFDASTGVSSLGLVFAKASKEHRGDLEAQVRAQIYRASDSVYRLEDGTVAAIVGECRKSDLKVIVERMGEALGKSVQLASIHCPDDAVDPEELIARIKS